MKIYSAGILAYKYEDGLLNILLAHPGGPFFVKKDKGVWSIPKGEFDPETEHPLEAAKREFFEETGQKISGEMMELSPTVLKSGKTVFAWAKEMEFDCSNFKCNTFKLEWPPKSNKFHEFPEMDRIEWFTLDEAKDKIHPAQLKFVDELLLKIGEP